MECYVNVKCASEILGIKVRTVREWIRVGKIKAIKYPNCSQWFISNSEIERLTKDGANEDED